MAAKFKLGDMVKVISGSYRGQSGRIIHVDPKNNQVIVEDINKKSVRTSRFARDKSRVEKSLPLHVSNVSHFVQNTGTVSRVRFDVLPDGSKQRVLVKTGEVIDV